MCSGDVCRERTTICSGDSCTGAVVRPCAGDACRVAVRLGDVKEGPKYTRNSAARRRSVRR